MSIAELLSLIEADYIMQARRSLITLRCSMRHLLRLLGDREAEDLRGRDIERYKRSRLAEEAARSTVNNELAALRRAYRLAQDQEILARAPAIRSLKVENTRHGFIEPGDFARLLGALREVDADVADLVEWLYFLGWRRGQARSLLWSDVDLEDFLIVVPGARTKSGHAHLVKLPGSLEELLRRRAGRARGPLVFHRGGKPIRDFRAAWRRAAAAIGRPELRVHDLRRSFARNATRAGCPQKLVMDLGGWRTGAVFARYAITDERALSAALDQITGFVHDAAGKKDFA